MKHSIPKNNRIEESIYFKDLSLLQKCINIKNNERTNFKNTLNSSLILSIEQNWIEGTQFLIEAGTNVNFMLSLDDYTPIGLAVHLEHLQIIELLLQAGAYADGKGLDVPLITAVSHENIDIVERLINAGANLNLSDEIGKIPLIIAISKENFAMTKLLLKSGALVNTNWNYHPSGEETPLMAAVQTGNMRIIQLLLQSGAVIDTECYQSQTTALYVAAVEGHQEVFEYLFPMTTDSQEREYALKELPNGIIRKQRREDKLTVNFISAATKGDILGVKEAIEAGVNINAFGESGETALHQASANGCVEVIRLLVQAGANVEIRSESRFELGETPLEMAVMMSWSSEAVKILLEAGANSNSTVDPDQTLLMLAASDNNLEVAKILLDAGVDINAKTDRGDTALEIARRCKYKSMVQFLKEAGAVGNSEIDIDSDEIPF